jgi:hypothetical protein
LKIRLISKSLLIVKKREAGDSLYSDWQAPQSASIHEHLNGCIKKGTVMAVNNKRLKDTLSNALSLAQLIAGLRRNLGVAGDNTCNGCSGGTVAGAEEKT